MNRTPSPPAVPATHAGAQGGGRVWIAKRKGKADTPPGFFGRNRTFSDGIRKNRSGGGGTEAIVGWSNRVDTPARFSRKTLAEPHG